MNLDYDAAYRTPLARRIRMIYSAPAETDRIKFHIALHWLVTCFLLLKTDGRERDGERERERVRERENRNFGEKFPDENLANMGDPRTHAESTDRWGILKIEKSK